MGVDGSAEVPLVEILEDRDFTYFVANGDLNEVYRLADSSMTRGLVAAVARPFRVRKLSQLVGVVSTGADYGEPGFAEVSEPLLGKQLAEAIATK